MEALITATRRTRTHNSIVSILESAIILMAKTPYESESLYNFYIIESFFF